MGTRDLRPVGRPTDAYGAMEGEIVSLLKKELYLPLLEAVASKKILNAREGLIDAIVSGRVMFERGAFKGKFSAVVSKELKSLGAKWTGSDWKIHLSSVPPEIDSAIRTSKVRMEQAFKKVDEKLSEFLPEKLSAKLRFKDLFDKTMWSTNKKLEKSLDKISIIPKISKETYGKLSDEWANNMDLYIQGWAAQEIKELRQKIQKAYLSGKRYDDLIQEIKNSYGVGRNKARFLARQETNLIASKFKEARYKEAGVHEYKWRCVVGTTAHPTRPRHKALNDASEKGTLFRFDNPPVTTEPGEPERRNNPGEDFNCRCNAIPVVKF
jgi:SPP1 gp7 family putative phage head morphogenesis protein